MRTFFTLLLGIGLFSTTLLPLAAQDGDEQISEVSTAKKKKKIAKKGFPFKYEKNLKKALAKAKAHQVPVFLLFTNPATCPYCVKLENEVLNTKEWKKGVAGKLVGVYVDNASKDKEARAFGQRNGVRGIPTFFILAPDGSVLSRGGYNHSMSVADYVKMVDDACKQLQSASADEAADED